MGNHKSNDKEGDWDETNSDAEEDMEKG